MKIIVISNYINHYMCPLVDELNKLNNVEAYFAETEKLPDSFKKSGFSDYDGNENYIKIWKSAEEWKKAMNLSLVADVLIISSSSPKIFERERLKRNLLTFEYTERPLKRGWLNIFSPTNLRNQLYYHFIFRKKPLYMLCFSAFTALDENRMHSFKGRCFKFGYLPRIDDYDIEKVLEEKRDKSVVKFIWCARFIEWKHPELPVLLAERLAKEGYKFKVNMIGSGKLYNIIDSLIKKKNLQNYVCLLGNFQNEEVLKIMKEHHVFLFTSDRREGWGVVLNEAMGQLCCPVASNMIGSVPFMLNHKSNGLIFQSQYLESLYENVKYLLDNPDHIEALAENAYTTVRDVWNPSVGASRLYNLCESLLHGQPTVYDSGPCSIALPNDWHTM